MIVTFEESYLRELFESGKCSDNKHRYQPDVVKRYKRRIEQLMAASRPETLYHIGSLHFEKLVGDRAGRFSIRVNDKYRIEFTIVENGGEAYAVVCNIIELSKHYE